MAAELRWILLALSLVLLAGIWWWGRRRSSQAPGDAQLREMTPSVETPAAFAPQPYGDLRADAFTGPAVKSSDESMAATLRGAAN